MIILRNNFSIRVSLVAFCLKEFASLYFWMVSFWKIGRFSKQFRVLVCVSKVSNFIITGTKQLKSIDHRPGHAHTQHVCVSSLIAPMIVFVSDIVWVPRAIFKLQFTIYSLLGSWHAIGDRQEKKKNWHFTWQRTRIRIN